LIEIGIEKLKNDYTQAFLISKIALADHLKLEMNNKLVLCICLVLYILNVYYISF